MQIGWLLIGASDLKAPMVCEQDVSGLAAQNISIGYLFHRQDLLAGCGSVDAWGI